MSTQYENILNNLLPFNQQQERRGEQSDWAVQSGGGDELTPHQVIQLARVQTWAMSFIFGLLTLFAITAVTRIPIYLAESNFFHLVATILFGLLILAGLIDNIRTHIYLYIQSKRTNVTK